MPSTRLITSKTPAGVTVTTTISIFNGYYDWWVWFYHNWHHLKSLTQNSQCFIQMTDYFDKEFAPCYGGFKRLGQAEEGDVLDGTSTEDVLSFETKCVCLTVHYRRLIQGDWTGISYTHPTYDKHNNPTKSTGVPREKRKGENYNVPQISEWVSPDCPRIGPAIGITLGASVDHVWWMERRYSEAPFHLYNV